MNEQELREQQKIRRQPSFTGLRKIQPLRRMNDQGGLACELDFDGGIDAGAEVLVQVSSIFDHREGTEPAIRELQRGTEDKATTRQGGLCA